MLPYNTLICLKQPTGQTANGICRCPLAHLGWIKFSIELGAAAADEPKMQHASCSLAGTADQSLVVHADSKALLQANLDSARAHSSLQRHETNRAPAGKMRSLSPPRRAGVHASWDKPAAAPARHKLSPPASPATPEMQRPKSVKEASHDLFEAALTRPKRPTNRTLQFPAADTAVSGQYASRPDAPISTWSANRWDQSFSNGMHDLARGCGKADLPPCMQGALDCMHGRTYSPPRQH